MQWTNDLAYVVGLISSDGNLSKDGRHIELTSKDIEQVKNFQKILKLTNKIGTKKSSYNSGNTYFRIQFGNVKFYRFLLSLGLLPNKTKILKALLIPDSFFVDYLRGYLDGDGYTNSYWDKRWKSSFMLYTGFVSASKEHLIWLKNKIKGIYDLQGSIKYNGKSTYQLMYAKHSSLVLLKKIYYKKNLICLSRKRFKIEQALGIIQKNAGMAKLENAQS